MSEAFFTEVTGPIRYEGLDSIEPARVQGLRQGPASSSASGWRSTSASASASGTRSPGTGRDMFGIGTMDRPWLRSGRRPDGRGPAEDGRRLRVPRASSASPTTASTTATSRRTGRRFAEFRANLADARRRRARLPGADRRPAAVGHGQPVHPPALPGRRLDQPRPRGLRLRRGAGQAHARGHPAAGRRELRAVGRPRGLRHAAQHRPPARGRPARPVPAPRRRAQAQDRLHGHAAHRAQADGADQAPVRLRLGDRPRLPRPQRPRGRVPAQHRGQPRDAGRATRSTTRSPTRWRTG